MDLIRLKIIGVSYTQAQTGAYNLLSSASFKTFGAFPVGCSGISNWFGSSTVRIWSWPWAVVVFKYKD